MGLLNVYFNGDSQWEFDRVFCKVILKGALIGESKWEILNGDYNWDFVWGFCIGNFNGGF